jgi:hypothetical protein
MTKTFCPFMSYQTQYDYEAHCFEKECGLWDKEKEQCCFKTMALAATAKPSVTPVVFQPSVHTTPAVVPNGTGDWVDPNPYRINCSEEYEQDQVVFSALHNALKEEYKL